MEFIFFISFFILSCNIVDFFRITYDILNTMVKSFFLTNFFEQKRTIQSLLSESKAESTFYVFLSVAAFITTLGLLMDSVLILIGGMFVAPLLFPILSLGMGIATSSSQAITRAVRIILKSAIIVSIVSFATAFILGSGGTTTNQMLLASSPNLLLFLAAFAAGIIAAFAWIKENITTKLPGIAVTVTLLPPLSVIGISISLFSRELFAGSLALFIINLLGIIVGSTIIFALFGFSGLQKVEEERIEEEKKEAIVHKEARREAKVESME